MYDQAGSPPLAFLVELGRRRSPHVRLSTSSLSEWLHGDGVPRSIAVVEGLVALLQELAARKGVRPALLPWQELHAAAQEQERQTGRRSRPTSQRWQSPMPTSPALVVGDLGPDDALRFEVHPAVAVGPQPMAALPPYIERPAFDHKLRAEVAAAMTGSRMVMALGGSSTGKTRACWEAVQRLLPSWVIVRPLTPDRPSALLEAIRTVQPCTVLWLNEAQHYLSVQDRDNEVAAALQELLASKRQSPVLVLGTMWPEHWSRLIDDSAGEGEELLHRSALQQLTDFSALVSVPAAFTAEDLSAASAVVQSDPRLALAWRRAQSRRITQYLAGAPHLWSRYTHATPAATAVLHAAMDARRNGHGALLREEFLRQASTGYIDDSTWHLLSDAWFESALTELLRLHRRLPGPLQRFRPRPGEPNPPDCNVYLLADYLHERSLGEREGHAPAASLWAAAATHCHTARDLIEMAHAAQEHHVMNCPELFTNAAEQGDLGPVTWFVHRLIDESHLQRASDLIDRFGLGDAVRGRYAEALTTAGRLDEAERVARSIYDNRRRASSVRQVAYQLEHSGQSQTAARLYGWAAEAGDSVSMHWIASYHEDRGDQTAAEEAAHRALRLGSPHALIRLAHQRLTAGLPEKAEQLCRAVAAAGYKNLLVIEAREHANCRDHATALLYYQVAGEWRHPEAMEWLSWRSNGRGEHQAAEQWAYKAARAGRPHALHTLAHLRFFEGQKHDALRLNKAAAEVGSEQALAWLRRHSASVS